MPSARLDDMLCTIMHVDVKRSSGGLDRVLATDDSARRSRGVRERPVARLAANPEAHS